MLLAIGLLAVGALLTEHGFVVAVAVTPWIQLAGTLLAGVYLLDRVLLLARGPNRWVLIRQRQFEFAVLVLFATLALGLASSSTAAASVVRLLHQHDTRDLWLDLLRLFLLANVLVQILRS